MKSTLYPVDEVHLQTLSVLVLWMMSMTLGGCFEERANLTGPITRAADSAVAIRFANFVDDTKPRKVNVHSTTDDITLRKLLLINPLNGADSLRMESFIPFSSMTAVRFASIDSATAGLQPVNASQTYFLPNRIRFSPRASYNTMIAIGSPIANGQDTLITITTPRTPEIRANNAFTLRVVNAYSSFNAPQLTFSLRLGCPSGQSVVQNLASRIASGPIQLLPESTVTLSLIASQANRPDIFIGAYAFAPKALGYYTAVICRDLTANDTTSIPAQVTMIDETASTSAFYPVTKLRQQQTQVQFLNLTSSVGTGFLNGSANAVNLSANGLSALTAIPACASTTADMAVFRGGNIRLTLAASRSYALIAADSSNGQAIVAAELAGDKPPSTAARLRVVNLAWNDVAEQRLLSVVLGARMASTGFIEETPLQSGLRYGTISDAVNIPAGTASTPLPVMIFSGEQPQRLLQTGLDENVKAGHNYLLIISRNRGDIQLYLMDEAETTARTLAPIQTGVVVKALNAVASSDQISCSLGNIVRNAPLRFGQTFTTILSAGNVMLATNSPLASITLPIAAGERGFAVFSDSTSNGMNTVKIFATATQSLSANLGMNTQTAFVKFFNAASDIPEAKCTINPDINVAADGVRNFIIPLDTTRIDSTGWKLIDSSAIKRQSFRYGSFAFFQIAGIVIQQRSRILAWNPAFVRWDSRTLFADWNMRFQGRRVFADVNNIIFPFGTATTIVLVRSRQRVAYDALPDDEKRGMPTPAPYLMLFISEY
jgi:hypothetical protein